MALRALILRKKIDGLKKSLASLEPKIDEVRKKTEEFQIREAELEAAINEVTEETTEEERSAVNEEVDKFEEEKKAHDEEAADLEDQKKKLEEEIESTEAELAEVEEKQEEKPAEKEPEPEPEEVKPAERKVESKSMNMRKILNKMSAEERTALLNENVKNWLGEYRSAIKEKRAISNVGLTIPTEILPLLRENVQNWSKLYDRVNVVAVSGEARQPIMGTIPEAIWTECCANLNELDLAFNDWTMDCFKVGGYFAVCKANAEDSDIDLLAAIVEALGQAIGKALDKAILFGRNTTTNSKMPLGVVSRILQEAAPSDYPSTARAWADLHTSHVTDITGSGTALLSGLVNASAKVSTDYSRGEILWAMNDATYKKIVAETLEVNQAGAIVAGVNGRMPVVGGDIVVLNFIPDNVIVYGYFDLYTLAERAGREFAQSEHVRFLQDQIVYKGTARYDGAPIIAEAFAIATLNGATVSAASVTFPQDTSNNA